MKEFIHTMEHRFREFKRASYKKSGIRPQNDWFVLLSSFAIGVVIVAIFSVYVYEGVKNNMFWVVSTDSQGGTINTLHKKELQTLRSYFDKMESGTTGVDTAPVVIGSTTLPVKGVPADPSL